SERAWPRTSAAARRGGDILAATGRVEQALELLGVAVSLAEDGTEAARALGRIGALQAHQSRHPQALEALREALQRGGDGLEPRDRAEILATLAKSAVLSGAVDDAALWSEEGLTAAGDDDALAARLGYAKGLVRYFRGELPEAHDAFGQALAAARRTGDRVEEAGITTGLGLVAHRKGDLDGALDHYRAALKLGEETGDQARVLSALQNLGVVFHERGEWIAALDTYREALGLAEALAQTGRVVQISGNLGNLWRYLGELDRAREVLQIGLERARSEGNRYMEGLLLNLLGDVASDDEAWDQAERLWLDAIRVTEEAQCAAEEAEARLNLGRLQLERQSYEPARSSLERALEVAERVSHATFTSQSLALLAAVERVSVHGALDRAQAHIDRALALLPQVDNPGARWPILLEAAWIARDTGDLDAAADRVREVRQLLQSQLDAVPARHRTAFRARRDRRRALADTATFVAATRSGERAQARDRGWNRLLEINKRLATEHNPTRLLEYIMDSAIQLTDAERGFLLLDEDSHGDEDLAVHVARNLDQENIRNKQLKISHGIARRVVESGMPAITIDAMEDERYRDQLSVHDLRLRSILCLPMIGRGRVLGAIYLDNRFRSSAFSEADLPFMEAFADLAAIALDNARLIDAQERAQKALEKARAEVEALNKRLEGELEARTQELADTHRVVIRQQRELVARHQYDNIIGQAPSVRRLFAMMDRLLDNDVPVLIEGESGTGKELVARAIHFNGARQSRPFVAVNCGAIPPSLLESELFGHVRGAFTNATSDKKGLFEAAHTGTLLLDEIGELPLEMQVKLLRVLQSGEVKKVGSTREIKVDVRILAATNRKLDEEVRAQRFREDLYYRLSVVPIQIPPLRARKEDIPLLVQHFLEQNRAAGLGNVAGISKPALALLQRYSWPGNIRQLEMVLKNASVFAEGQTLEPRDFESFPDIIGHESASPAQAAALLGKTLAEIEREAIIAALRENQGNKKRSAEQLGIDRRTLYNKLSAYNIVVERELRVR
ncbi:MAG: tetratricopeptide repeat protein, partial [Deltaproteobacteria bacterium]